MSNEYELCQKPAVELLNSLGWKTIQDPRNNFKNVLLEDILVEKLDDINYYYHKGQKYKFSKNNVLSAIRSLRVGLDQGLNVANSEVYDLLTGSRSFKGEDGKSKTFRFIDFNDFSNNAFHLVEEFKVKGKDKNIRPDIVLFINGIPMVTIECKDPGVDVMEGVTQNIRNQRKDYAPDLYKYIQLTIATNKNELRYGTCETPKKFYSLWKEDYEEWLNDKLKKHVHDRLPTKQDKDLISLLSIDRFFDIFKNFILFDNNVKKVARYQQFFAVKEMLKRIEKRDAEGNRKGGVIWHTQGSGKSLTMVMLTKALVGVRGIINAKIVVVTDRVNLDAQITQTFKNTDLRPHAAGSGRDLVHSIKNDKEIITTTVHKFEKAYKEKLVDESKDVFILVDESHRTEYGKLNQYMNKVFPNACYIGFTGTPLMKEEKNTMQKFGGIIHQYTIQDAVEDKAIVPLIYEGKMVDQSINDKGIDNKLKQIIKNLNEREAADLKRKWSRYNKMASSDSRIDFIAFDINEHFVNQFRKHSQEFKAMLATNSKAEAVTYYRKLQNISDLNIAVMVSPPDTREGFESVTRDSKDIVIKHW